MKQLSALLLLLALSARTDVNAQKNDYQLKGYMGVQGGESFHYDLQLKDSSGNLLSGYASTYQNPENNVKTYVVAEVDRSSKTLYLKEETIVENNYFKSKAIICLVEVRLKYSSLEKNLYGTLITMTAGNGANCSKGSINFSNKDEIDHLFNPVAAAPAPQTPARSSAPKVTVLSRKPLSESSGSTAPIAGNTVPAPAAVPAAVITEGQDKTYQWHSDEIVLEIWDGTTVDNDRVSISINGTEVLTDYTLTKARKEIRLPVGGNELNIISIKALNEGSEPPNTANILLKDGDTSYDIVAHNKFGKSALIKIRKKL